MHAHAALALFTLAAAGLCAEYSCDFDRTPPADLWDIHQAGAGLAQVSEGSLLLDMSAPTKGKHVWADLRLVIKLPASIQWDHRLEHDSSHFYLGGVHVAPEGAPGFQAGLTGKPMGYVAHFSGARSEKPLPPGKWYRFAMHIGADHHGTLRVTDRQTAAEVASFSRRVGGLAGRLCTLSFYHNQPRNQGPDGYDQDRGACRVDNISIDAAALQPGGMSDYRDKDLRGYDTREPMTFNRVTVWLGEDQGLRGDILAYDRAPELYLTGKRQVASWQENRLCEMRPKDDTTSTFIRPNDLDGYDCATVRSFQWCVRQHPTLEYAISPHGQRCYLAVTLVCPYLGAGIELFRTQQSDQPTRGNVDLAQLMDERGLGYHQFAEIGVFLYQDRPQSEAARGEADLMVKLAGTGALLTSAPITRSVAQAAEGIDIHACLPGPNGELMHSRNVKLTAGPQALSMQEIGDSGVFTARLDGLPVGGHEVALRARDREGQTWETALTVDVTDGEFATWKPDRPTYQLRDGRVLPCLLGDLYAWVPMLDPASPTRRVISSAAQYNELPPADRERVRLIKLRTLSPSEIRAQLQQHHDNGIRVIRLTPNVTPHESYLDAGGHVSMHGLEALKAVLRECRRLRMKAVINLFHYPYWSSGTGKFPPWQQYIDAGYEGYRSFTDPQIAPILKQYLRELLTCLKDDPAVLAYSLTGENDQTYGPEFINDLFDHVMVCDPNHMVTQEQGGGAERCAGGTPWGYDEYRTTKSAGLGYRTYYTAGMKSDAYFMVCARFYGANAPVFTAEYASGPGWYAGFAPTWQHPDFITKVRDNCWTSLLTRQTMSMSWSAPWTQQERLIPHLCAEQIDWNSFTRRRPPVAIKLTNVEPDTLRTLARYEADLARLAIDYDYLWEGREHQAAPGSYQVVLDAAVEEPDVTSIPPAVLAAAPVAITGEYSVNYLLSDDRTQMIAFVKNTAQYRAGPGYGRGVQELHRRRTKIGPLTVRLRATPVQCEYLLYDVDERNVLRRGHLAEDMVLDMGPTSHDFAILVRPAQ